MILPLFLYNFTPVSYGVCKYFCVVEMLLHEYLKAQNKITYDETQFFSFMCRHLHVVVLRDERCSGTQSSHHRRFHDGQL